MSSHTLTINITLRLPEMSETVGRVGELLWQSGQFVRPFFGSVSMGRFEPEIWAGLSPRERAELNALISGPIRN